ncbi:MULTISPECIES: toll/interleukin-1 receptor domain-containing protein [Protofrankia]|uniref:toll/interleukin-1 receptor domain-containing protein n=1 Tax=Protofrankia TaxID=2994361 RepID=UPI0012F6785C|nr:MULTISPECIES: TIR domain-containing protein [Protofrankia]
MKIFISWSGDTSKQIAEIFRDWLPILIHEIDVFVSSQDIGGGTRALDVLADELDATSYGLIVTTKATQSAPWINFESGALAKHVAKSRVVPILIDLGVSDLKNPLAQFQAIDSRQSDAMVKLVREINAEASPRPVVDEILRKRFEAFWPELDEKLATVRSTLGKTSGEPAITEKEMMAEIRAEVRRQSHQIFEISARISDALPKGERQIIFSQIATYMISTEYSSNSYKHTKGDFGPTYRVEKEPSKRLTDFFDHVGPMMGQSVQIEWPGGFYSNPPF